ncbi:hypothetical protein M3Y98_00518600 [Aphelenchoides besseyi]|nr:hypothetical protein M3Y98_00518600 [Aphelenchoides besseyi]KAI6207923.1 hypothetical protein M3Y96_00060200 [Aphelenchoides besseyi]
MESTTSTASTSPPQSVLNSLRSPSSSTIRVVTKLKRKLTTKKKVVEFLDNNRPVFHQILKSMDQLISSTLPSTDQQSRAYESGLCRELISLTANLCHLSFGAAIEIKKMMPTFSNNALRVLENNETNSAIKTAMLRLLGNLAEYKETASICQSTLLLDRQVLMINDENLEVSNAALRTVRLLCKHRHFSKSVVMSNGAYHIGVLMAKRSTSNLLKDENLLRVLEMFRSLGRTIILIGRQLAQSECAPKLLEILLSDSTAKNMNRLQMLIIQIAKEAFDLRESFGVIAISSLVATQRKTRQICAFLSYFARDAWGRQALRTEHALKMILERLIETDSLDEQSDILSELTNFIHEPAGLAYICRRSEIVDVFVRHATDYLEERGESEQGNCTSNNKPTSNDQLETGARGEIENSTMKKLKQERTFAWPEYSRQSGSMSPLALNSFSPMSLSPTSSLSPNTTPPHSLDESWESGSASSNPMNKLDDEPKVEIKTSTRESIANNCILILSYLMNRQNQDADFLVKEDTLRLLIRYLAEGPTLNKRLYRLLSQIVQSRLLLDKLLDLCFPIMIIFGLLRRPCLMERFATPCAECLKRYQLGIDLLQTIMLHTDSSFGVGILEDQYALDGDRRTYALLQGLTLLSRQESRNRLYARWNPINSLLKTFAERLLNRNEETCERDDKLLLDIVAVFSVLTSRRYFCKLIGNRPKDGHQYAAEECALVVPSNIEPQLSVKRTNGTSLMSIRKDDGLLGHEAFIENQATTVDFVFDPDVEACDEEDFVLFLHFLAGCRNKTCVQIDDAKTCAALLYLSDKYSCSELSDALLSSNGSVRRFVNGSNLIAFLPICLSSWLIRDRIGSLLTLVFFKYSSDAQLKQVFTGLAGNQTAIDMFVDMISDFLKNLVECFRHSVYLPTGDFV